MLSHGWTVLNLNNMIMTETVYTVSYNPCVYESGLMTLSLHRTKKGAYLALKKLLFDKHEQWIEGPKRMRDLYCIQNDERYFIKEMKVKD